METAYLLSTKANAAHLAKSIAQHKDGQAVRRELVDVDVQPVEFTSYEATLERFQQEWLEIVKAIKGKKS